MTDEIRRYHVDDPNDAPDRRLGAFPTINPFLPTSLTQYVIPPVEHSLKAAIQYYWHSAYLQGVAAQRQQQQQLQQQQQQQQRLQQQQQHSQLTPQDSPHHQLHQLEQPPPPPPPIPQPPTQSLPQHHHIEHTRLQPNHHHHHHHHQLHQLQDLQRLQHNQHHLHLDQQHRQIQQQHSAATIATTTPDSLQTTSATGSPGSQQTATATPDSQQRDDEDDNDSNHHNHHHHHHHNHHNEQQREHIKKPLNPFMIFMQKQRPSIVRQGEIKESAAINQLLGQRWRSLTRQEQEPYYKLAEQEKLLHAEKYPGWSARDNYANQRKRRKLKLKATSHLNDNSDKKCRARYGLANMASWCKPCRRKKRCIYSMARIRRDSHMIDCFNIDTSHNISNNSPLSTYWPARYDYSKG